MHTLHTTHYMRGEGKLFAYSMYTSFMIAQIKQKKRPMVLTQQAKEPVENIQQFCGKNAVLHCCTSSDCC